MLAGGLDEVKGYHLWGEEQLVIWMSLMHNRGGVGWGVQSRVLENWKRWYKTEKNSLKHDCQDNGYFVAENIFIFSFSIGMLCSSDCAFVNIDNMRHFVWANQQIVELCKMLTNILFCPTCARIGELLHMCALQYQAAFVHFCNCEQCAAVFCQHWDEAKTQARQGQHHIWDQIGKGGIKKLLQCCVWMGS